MNNKLLKIPKILLLVTDSFLVVITMLDYLRLIKNWSFILLFPLIAISIVSFFKPKLGGILIFIATILTFLEYLWLTVAFLDEFHLSDMLRIIPLLLIFYLFIGVMFIAFSIKIQRDKRTKNEASTTTIEK